MQILWKMCWMLSVLILVLKKLREPLKLTKNISFKPVPEDLVHEINLSLDSSKTIPVGDIPADMLKSAVDIHLLFVTKIISYSFENGCFPDELKLAEVSPIFKKNDDLDKENYKLISVLSHVPKVFERIMYKQIDIFMRDKVSKPLIGFRKNHSTQHYLMSMLEIWKNTLNKGGYVSDIFIDLSKAFDTLNYNLLIAKLGAYGLERDSLSFMKSYLNEGNSGFVLITILVLGKKIIAGVPQGSILRPLLFNI